MASLAEDFDSIPTAGAAQQSSTLVDDFDKVPVIQPEPSWFDRVKAAGSKFQGIVDRGNILTAPVAAGETVLSGLTNAPLSLLRHGVEEGAYLSGEKPARAHTISEETVPSGYQPRTEAGKALTGLIGAVGQPIADVGAGAAQMIGGSPALQNIGGDISSVAAGKAIEGLTNQFKTRLIKPTPSPIPEPVLPGTTPTPVSPAAPATLGEIPATPAPGSTVPPVAAPETAGAASAPTYTIPPLSRASPGLLESVQTAARNGETIDPAALARHLEADTLPIPMRMSEGQASGDIHLISNERNMRAKVPEYADLFDEQNQHLIDNANALRDKAAPDVTDLNHVESGQSLIDAYKSMDDIARADISAKYQALKDANGGEFPLDGKTFAIKANQALGAEMKGPFLPTSIQNILAKFQTGEQPMTYENFENLRTILAAEARKAERAGDGNTATAVSSVRNELEQMPMTNETAAIKPLADAARSAAKARFDALKADPAYKAAVNDTIAPDDFINRFLIKGKAGDVATMNKNLAVNPIAQQTMAAGTLNYLKRAAGIVDDRGDFGQAGYNKALAAIRPKLGELLDPETANQVQQLGNVAYYVKNQPKAGYVNNSNTFVAGAANVAKNAAESALNVKTLGIPVGSWIRQAAQKKAATKEIQKTLKPGAGLTRPSEFPE